MESIGVESPKDEHVINKDDSVTNKDGNNYLEKGEQPTDDMRPEKEATQTTSDNVEKIPPAEEGTPKKDSKSGKWVL